MSEAYPDDRGAVMGLYRVFLGLGQILGSFVGGVAAEQAAIDGLLVATLDHDGHRAGAAVLAAALRASVLAGAGSRLTSR